MNRFFRTGLFSILVSGASVAQGQSLFNDSHFHLTNYIQEGTEIKDFLKIMGDKVDRVALFGIPLMQTWSYGNSAENAPTYYLQSDAPLYYYSFTDTHIAMAYNSLSAREKARFEPMITGFNPADMYAADHIKRVLKTFPGVFTGIGEFSIHKEFVSSKVAGEVASLLNPALDRILDFCAESGLLVILHNDVDVPFQKEGEEPVFMRQMKELVLRHQETTIIWAHTGLGRVVHPTQMNNYQGVPLRSPFHLEMLKTALENPDLDNLFFDISWDQVAKYIIESPESVKKTADLINAYPDRFLFGTDEVAPKTQESYLKVYQMYQPLWTALSPEAKEMVTKGNFNRLFDTAKGKVRTWEKAQGWTK